MSYRECPEGMIEVTVCSNGESVSTTVPDGATIQALFDNGHLRGIQTGAAAFRVNGQSANQETALRNGDRVNAVPTGGKLA